MFDGVPAATRAGTELPTGLVVGDTGVDAVCAVVGPDVAGVWPWGVAAKSGSGIAGDVCFEGGSATVERRIAAGSATAAAPAAAVKGYEIPESDFEAGSVATTLPGCGTVVLGPGTWPGPSGDCSLAASEMRR